jgi:phosphoglycerate dehydrogenase-like enzyme
MQVIIIANKYAIEEYTALFKKEGLDAVFVTDNINEQKLFEKYKINHDAPKILAIAMPEEIGWDCNKNLIEKLGNIKGICSKSSWIEYIDLKYCDENQISVLNNKGLNSQSVAENAIFMMFALARKLSLQMHEKFESYANTEHEHTEIFGKTAGIIGLGNVGRRIANMCKGLGMNVVYWSKASRDENFKYQPLVEVMKNSDIVFNSIETNKETENFFNKELISNMKTTSFFVSVIGGCGFKVEDNDCLINAVITGKLAGYAVENEHHKDYTLPVIPGDANIFMPGAYGYFTKEANERALENWMKNIKSLL